jgi:hypothetical protein
MTDNGAYDGNTSCIEVRSSQGTLVVIDCGTGGHSLAQQMISGGAKHLRGGTTMRSNA